MLTQVSQRKNSRFPGRDRFALMRPQQGAGQMFAEEIRRVLSTTPRADLCALSGLIWKGFAAGAISEIDAQALAEAIEARKIVPKAPTEPTRRVGSRPRSSASLERRRAWTTSGWMPSAIAARFTTGEAAALSVVLAEVALQSQCMLAIGCIAAKAGVCPTIVKRALRQARMLGLISVEERRLSYARNLPNVITVLSAELDAWIGMRRPKLRRAHGGGTFVPATKIHINNSSAKVTERLERWERETRVGARTMPFPPRSCLPH